MKLKKRLVVFLVMTIMVFNTFGVQATNNKHNENNGKFKDVKDDHWAREYIELMTKYGIINGYDDKSFKPESAVFRGEFAKMMVLTMQLDLINPGTGTFEDVKKGDWLYKHVETAKPYLTGFELNGKYYFKPSLQAQREDMAVAIVKGLGIEADKTDMSVLSTLKDENSISPMLRKYVAAAINEGIMVGDDNKYFNPKQTLTRAEAATLLARLIIEKKVVFDETKIVIDDTSVSTKKPVLTAKTEGSKIVLDWSNVEASGFNYYKVVLSKGDSTPSYPDNGYAKAISSVTTSGCELKDGDTYNGGDLGGAIKAGQTYYASITAVYGDQKYTSNVITIKIPGTSEAAARTTTLSSAVQGDKIVLDWSNVPATGFSYYKVVLSKSDSTPSYPSNGYAKVITSATTSGCELKAGETYNGGDLGGSIKAGQTYYASITAVYGDQKYTSNVVTITIPGTTDATIKARTTILSSSIQGDKVALDWSNVAATGFTYYKVVLSKSDSTPSYPDNGYAKVITSVTGSESKIGAGDTYSGGDLSGSVKAGETYYASITAVYGDQKYTSNVITIKIPGTSEAVVKARTTALTSSIQGDKVVLDWSNVEAAEFSNYKVVLSKSDSTPSYPENGYAKSITSVTTSGCEIKAGDTYYSGDISGSVKAGETYYASITAVYGDQKYTSNVVTIKIPGINEETARTAVLTSSTVDGKIKLAWTKTDATKFTHYKVVLSKYNTSPSYPDDGYVAVISDNENINYVLVAGTDYQGGDVETITSGQTYYATITSVYEDGKYTSNVITITIP
ncbi:MAG: hypothetical protein CVU84_07285 [Firmicutes bacterium HGW-Firmicutes-1]|jgi:hypothetical protein|nr:MAG: hypothetical protein CVU84_07285 [Firmicutes bacterium HGW-Firmicutes-1]